MEMWKFMNDKTPQHIEQKIYELAESGEISQKEIATKFGVTPGTVSKIKKRLRREEGKRSEVKADEGKRRENISKSVATYQAISRGEIVAEGFIHAFHGISENIQEMRELSDNTKNGLNKIAGDVEKLLQMFEDYIDIAPEESGKDKMKTDIVFELNNAINQLNDFYKRGYLIIQSRSELRKNLETFLKLKAEIMDTFAIQQIMNAFFTACDELDDKQYRIYRDKVVSLAPATTRLFAAHEQTTAEDIEN